MYDINKFLEDRSKIYKSIEKSDYQIGSDSIYIEQDLDGHTLHAHVLIEQTESNWGYSNHVEVLESSIFTREEDKIELTNEQNEVIKNVIKSLL